MNKTYHLGEGLISKMHWQGFTREDISSIARTDPLRLESLILSLGWKIVRYGNDYHIWQKLYDRTFNQVSIPIDKNLPNYTEMLLYAVYDVYLFEDVTREELVA